MRIEFNKTKLLQQLSELEEENKEIRHDNRKVQIKALLIGLLTCIVAIAAFITMWCFFHGYSKDEFFTKMLNPLTKDMLIWLFMLIVAFFIGNTVRHLVYDSFSCPEDNKEDLPAVKYENLLKDSRNILEFNVKDGMVKCIFEKLDNTVDTVTICYHYDTVTRTDITEEYFDINDSTLYVPYK